MLTGFLDWQRLTVRRKCEGLSDEQAYEIHLSTSPKLTVAGVASHLRWTEWGWFSQSFPDEGQGVTPPAHDRGGWEFEPVALATLLDEYDAECDRSRQIVASRPLADIQTFTPAEFTPVSLRWIVTHMIDETARHLGHLDLLRELTDGATGY